jgi:2-C-methyl-D-erythritol 2,4-cyclodiphosphate synthase
VVVFIFVLDGISRAADKASRTGTETMETRIGFGYDSHVFKLGVPLRIGGLAFDHPEGLEGHSDGDVLLHAVTDALLGAIAAGDIGCFFPPGDPRWKGADSAIFLKQAQETLQRAGFRIVNIDCTLILAAPKIAPISGEMRARVADLLALGVDQVSIKAKTPEGLNLDHVAQCHAVALVEHVLEPDDLKSMSAVIESQRQLEDVVEDLLSSVHGVPNKRGGLVYDTEDIT